VRCQIWSTICAYLMVAIVKKRLNIQKSLNEILQIVSVSIFEQVSLEALPLQRHFVICSMPTGEWRGFWCEF
jgi:hypothetical protein